MPSLEYGAPFQGRDILTSTGSAARGQQRVWGLQGRLCFSAPVHVREGARAELGGCNACCLQGAGLRSLPSCSERSRSLSGTASLGGCPTQPADPYEQRLCRPCQPARPNAGSAHLPSAGLGRSRVPGPVMRAAPAPQASVLPQPYPTPRDADDAAHARGVRQGGRSRGRPARGAQGPRGRPRRAPRAPARRRGRGRRRRGCKAGRGRPRRAPCSERAAWKLTCALSCMLAATIFGHCWLCEPSTIVMLPISDLLEQLSWHVQAAVRTKEIVPRYVPNGKARRMWGDRRRMRRDRRRGRGSSRRPAGRGGQQRRRRRQQQRGRGGRRGRTGRRGRRGGGCGRRWRGGGRGARARRGRARRRWRGRRRGGGERCGSRSRRG